MSFVDVEDILEMNEGFIQRLFKEVLDVDVELPLPRLTYKRTLWNVTVQISLILVSVWKYAYI